MAGDRELSQDEEADSRDVKVSQLHLTTRRLTRKVEQLATRLERMQFGEYVALFEDTQRLIWLNFVAGLARGLGSAVGFTLLGALVIYVLQRVLILNLPVIGDFIAQIVKIVNQKLAR